VVKDSVDGLCQTCHRLATHINNGAAKQALTDTAVPPLARATKRRSIDANEQPPACDLRNPCKLDAVAAGYRGPFLLADWCGGKVINVAHIKVADGAQCILTVRSHSFDSNMDLDDVIREGSWWTVVQRRCKFLVDRGAAVLQGPGGPWCSCAARSWWTRVQRC